MVSMEPIQWSWKQRPLDSSFQAEIGPRSTGWTPCQYSPSQIHLELLANGLIKDPFIGENEKSVQWVGESDWLYQATFTPPAQYAHANLVLEGIDTFANIYVNGEKVRSTENMFQTYDLDIHEYIKPQTENTLTILFESAWRKGLEICDRRGNLMVWNGSPSRAYVRKAQYHYGWDSAPFLLTCGPWRPARIEYFDSRITDFHALVDVDRHLAATITCTASVEYPQDKAQVTFAIHDPDGQLVYEEAVPVRRGQSEAVFSLAKPRLWYPTGYGQQPLYKVSATISGQSAVSRRIGLRRSRVVEHPFVDEPGTSFYFEINNIPVFAGGSNWVPPDSFHCRVSRQTYRTWMERLVAGNQNMLRMWGGGVYEDDSLYEACDELGIMVWHDFCFACGQYPAHPEFLASVAKEVEDQLKRLRHHPSIVIWAGSNEDYQLAEAYNLTWDQDDTTSDFTKTNFPAREIYERLLPAAVDKFSPGVKYHYGSPYGGASTVDPTVGDTHQWNVWHGEERPYQDYYKIGSRFVSEFGMQGMCDLKTVRGYLEHEKDCYPQSTVNCHHNKADGAERLLVTYVIANMRFKFDMAGYIYATQLMQSEAVAHAFRGWRKQWKGLTREYCGGALVWQLNDTWPCSSWSLLDHFQRPKMAYYSIRRELARVHVACERYEAPTRPLLESKVPASAKSMQPPGPPFYYGPKHVTYSIWGVNSTLEQQKCQLQIEVIDILTGESYKQYKKTLQVEITRNGSTVFIEDFNVDETIADKSVLVTRFLDDSGNVFDRSACWPQPLKYLEFPDRHVTLTQRNGSVHISVNRPIKGFWMFPDDDKVSFHDNALDLMPGDDRTITVDNLSGDVKYTWYTQDLN